MKRSKGNSPNRKSTNPNSEQIKRHKHTNTETQKHTLTQNQQVKQKPKQREKGESFFVSFFKFENKKCNLYLDF